MTQKPQVPDGMDPYKTIMVCRSNNGTVISRIPVMNKNANDRLNALVIEHKGMTVDYEEDPSGGLLIIAWQAWQAW